MQSAIQRVMPSIPINATNMDTSFWRVSEDR